MGSETGIDAVVSITSGGLFTVNAAHFGFTSKNGEFLSAIRIMQLPSSGVLLFDPDGNGPQGAIPVALNAVISRADIDAGKFVFSPGVGKAGETPLIGFVVQGSGDQAAWSLHANTLTLQMVERGQTSIVARTVSDATAIDVIKGNALAVANTAVTWSSSSTHALIRNDGIISSTATDGRAINTSGTTVGSRSLVLDNLADGIIQSQNDAFRINIDIKTGMIRVNNAGTIVSTMSGQALDFDAVVSTMAGQIEINNAQSGVIRANGQDAIRPGANATINNSGLIYAAGEIGAKNDAIDWQLRTGIVNNFAGGMISGQRHGITSDVRVEVYNAAGGVIIGRNGSGVGSDGTGKVVNYGLIMGEYDGSGTGDGDGVDIDFHAEVDNYGIIRGTGAAGFGKDGGYNTPEGVALTAGGYLHNHVGGEIHSTNAVYAVDIDITNDGLISGSNFGVGIGGGTLTNTATGQLVAQDWAGVVAIGRTTIINAGQITGSDGVYGLTDQSVTFINAGLVHADYSAVQMGWGDDLLTIRAGSILIGAVNGGEGTDTLRLEDGATFDTGADFEILDVAGNAMLTGANNFASGVIAKGATLGLGGDAVLAFTAGIEVQGVLDLSSVKGVMNAAQVSGSGKILIGDGGLELTASTGTFGGVVTGIGALTLSAGTLNLSGEASWTGNTTISTGATLTLDGDYRNLTGTVTVNGGLVLGNGTLSGELAGVGVMSLTAGSHASLTLGHAFTGTVLLGNGMLELIEASAVGSTVFDFTGGDGTLAMRTNVASQSLKGLGIGDALVLSEFEAVTSTFYSDSQGVHVSDKKGHEQTIGLILDDTMRWLLSADQSGHTRIAISAAGPSMVVAAEDAKGLEDGGPVAIRLIGSGTDTVDHFTILTMPAHGTLFSSATGTEMVPLASTIQATEGAATVWFLPDADWFGGITLNFAAWAAGGGGGVGTASIAIQSVNDAPTSNDVTLAVERGVSRTLTLADFPFADRDGDALQGIVVAKANGSGAFLFDSDGAGIATPMAVTEGQVIMAQDIVAGKLTFAASGNNYGKAIASLDFKVQDDGGVARGGVDLSVATNRMTFDVMAKAVANKDIGTTTESAKLELALLANDDAGTGPAITLASINGKAVLPGMTVTLASGAQLLIGTDGKVDYDPNGKFDTLVAPVSGTTPGALGTVAYDRFTYALNTSATASVVVTVQGTEASNSPVFDGTAYLAMNPDLIRGGYDKLPGAALQHWLKYGLAEGRPTTGFDPIEYVASNVDLIRQGLYRDPQAGLQHWLTVGAMAGRPTTTFDPQKYLAMNPDLVAGGYHQNAALLEHWLEHGALEGRKSFGFDPSQYVAANADLVRAGMYGHGDDALKHWLTQGAKEGRPITGFDPLQYVAANPDLAAGGYGRNPAAALSHWIEHGAIEGRKSSGFDPVEYVASNPDLVRQGLFQDSQAALDHWLTIGAAQGRPTTGFDALEYLASNIDLVRGGYGQNLAAVLEHWLTHGASEGRLPNNFNPIQYLKANPDLAGLGITDTDAALHHWIDHGVSEGRPAIPVVAPLPSILNATSNVNMFVYDDVSANHVRIDGFESGIDHLDIRGISKDYPTLSGASIQFLGNLENKNAASTSLSDDIGSLQAAFIRSDHMLWFDVDGDHVFGSGGDLGVALSAIVNLNDNDVLAGQTIFPV